MDMLLTREEIDAWLLNRLGSGNKFDEFNRGFCKDLSKYQAKKAIEWFLSQATFLNWEWKDSKGVWDICLDDKIVQELKRLVE